MIQRLLIILCYWENQQNLSQSCRMSAVKGVFCILLVLTLLNIVTDATLTFDPLQIDKHQASFATAPCNMQTIIDFGFSSSTTMSCSGSCTVASPGSSSMTFLDVNGKDLSLTLIGAGISNVDLASSTLTGYTISSVVLFQFQTADGLNTVYVAVPITATAPTGFPTSDYVVNTINAYTADSNLQSLSTLNTTSIASNFPLSAFNFLNLRDYGTFYHLTTADKMTTILINTRIFYIPSAPSTFTNSIDSAFQGLTLGDTTLTGDKLCWGSTTTDVFQTHMRESIPLWFAWLSMFLFWLYVLISDENSGCFERQYKDNKWTSWSLYSIFHLSHEEFFTKMSRTVLFYMNIIWQGMVLCAIYSTVGPSMNRGIIVWSAAVAFAASIPIPYLIGYFFLRRIYTSEENKLQLKYKIKGMMDKNQIKVLEHEIYASQAHLYGLYYAYYAIFIIEYILFSALSVHAMQRLTRDVYYLHFYWLASIGIVIVFEHLLLQPIMAAIFGNSNWYRMRGYYYEAKLGELDKLVG